MFKLGIITDEVSQDPKVFFSFIREFSLDAMELRSVFGKGIGELSDDEIKSIKERADAEKIEIVSLASPVFKCDMLDKEKIKEHERLFERLCRMAVFCGAKFIRGFDFWKNGSSLAERKEMFSEILKIAEKYGIIYVLEYDPSVNSSSAKKIDEMVRAVNSPYFKAVYDPGNALWDDENAIPYPDDYDSIKENAVHIHIKDAIIKEGKAKAVKIGSGLVDYKGLMRCLIKDDYKGAVMLETHYKLSADISEELMKHPGGDAFSMDGEGSSRESMAALKKIIDEARKEI